MMRLLFLCLLLLPAATAVSEENREGSADGDMYDDEDEDIQKIVVMTDLPRKHAPDTNADKTTGVEDTTDQFTLIIIVVAVTVLTLAVATIVTIMLVRRQMNNRQQGIYSVPTEQNQKRFV